MFWWKRGRLDWQRDLRPLLAWFALAMAAGAFNGWVEHKYVGARGQDFDLSLLGRGLVAGRAVWFYVGQLVWPVDLRFLYPRWTVDPGSVWQWLFPLGLVAVAAGLWQLRGRTRGPLAGFLFFVGTLFPALGFVNLYGARYSWVWDHWQYLPDLGPLALAAAGLTALWQRAAPRIRWLGPGAAVALAGLLGTLSWAHCGLFRDDPTLFRTTLEQTPDSAMARTNLAVILA